MPETTLYTPPRPHPDVIARARLLARLDAALTRKLTVLTAPAGYGKTTLMGQWLTAHVSDAAFPAVAWLTLNADDSEPTRFWRRVVTACQRIWPGLGQSMLAMEPLSMEMALPPLLDDLARLRQPGLLILDDYQHITEPQIHQSLATLLDHLPAMVRLALLTRSEPSLPLARWRARGELSDLRANDLRFSWEETAAFFAQTLPTSLAAEATARLDPLLEGWPAGARMFAQAFADFIEGDRGPRVVAGIASTFAGSHQRIRDYFTAEVLDAQSQLTQMFLLRSSVLSRLSGGLCDEVVGGGDGVRMLARLARAGLFLWPLDETGQWYRYHPLFTEALRHEARTRLGDVALRACLRRAAHWYEREGMRAEAIKAALAADDMPHTAPPLQWRWPDGGEPATINDAQSLVAAVAPTRRNVDSLPPFQESTPRALPAPASTPPDAAEPLSAAEWRVLRLLAEGQTRQEIARELVVSVNTVKTHLQHIYRKLGVTTRAEAIRAARHLVLSGGRDARE